MKKKSQVLSGAFYSIAFIIFLIDFKTTTTGASQALELCLNTVIPSLFPFMIFSIILNSHYAGVRIKILNPICKICKIPAGCESVFVLGLLGGYPVGAQGIYQAWVNKQISKEQAHRLLGFCNNAGPAFIFGMALSIFKKPVIAWILWGIHIAGAIITGMLLPGVYEKNATASPTKPINFKSSLEMAIKTMAIVCSWIIIFRIIIAFIKKWFCIIFSPISLSILSGVLELANGCIDLYGLPSQGLKFILSSAFFALGGLCVAAQTISTIKEMGLGLYFLGKIIQCCISIVISCFVQIFIFPQHLHYHLSATVIGIVIFIPVAVSCYLNKKKVVAFIYSVLYNRRKLSRKEQAYAVSKKTDPGMRTLCSRNKI